MADQFANNKRVQVDKTQAAMLGVVVGASIITVFTLFACRAFYSQASYLNKVATQKEKAVKQLKTNEESVASLVKSYDAFALQNPNLIGGAPDGKGERDGDNGRLVLDALPSKYDFPALVTSLEKMLTGYTINGIKGTDDGAALVPANNSALAMPFTIDVTSDYTGIQKLSKALEKSIRPFQVTSLKLSGSNKKLQAVIEAQTYYLPEKDLNVNFEVVK